MRLFTREEIEQQRIQDAKYGYLWNANCAKFGTCELCEIIELHAYAENWRLFPYRPPVTITLRPYTGNIQMW